jgi:pimeloyl-ACP methyl ester carboxylesterase
MEPTDERVGVADGLELRLLHWAPAHGGLDGAGANAGLGAASGAGAASGGGAVPGAGAASPAQASPFLLVHGLASNARLWDGVARRPAAAGHPAVAVDLRGHGHSDKPDSGYDFATVSQDLRALIAALGPDFARPIVAGQSWGASVVLDFAVRHPDLTQGIVLVDGGLTDLRDAFPTWEICWDRLAPPPLVGMPLSAVEGYFRTNHADWPEEGFEGSLGNFEIRPDRTIAPWLSRDHHKAILEVMWGQRTVDLWRSLRVPALIVPVDGGESDWTAAKRAGAEAAYAAAVVSGVPVRTQWFKGDHDIHAQHPAELTEAILAAEREGFFSGAKTAPPAAADAAR